MKMLPFDDGKHSNFEIKISDEEYINYLKKALASFNLNYQSGQVIYQAGNHIEIIAEQKLKSGYIMIGADGFLLDDTKNTSYSPVCDCLTEDFSEGLKHLTFSEKLYYSRYNK